MINNSSKTVENDNINIWLVYETLKSTELIQNKISFFNLLIINSYATSLLLRSTTRDAQAFLF